MAVGGLGTGDVQAIRDGLAAGRRPRVVFTASAGQIAGQTGQVVALTDPAASDDWLVVRFGKDELPFSPGDLRVAPRGAAARANGPGRAGRKPAAPAPRPEPEFVIDKPVTGEPPGRRAGPAALPAARPGQDTPTAAASARPGQDSPSAGASTRPGQDSPSAGAPTPAADSAGPRGADPPARASGPRAGKAKGKPPAGLTVTLAYADGEWTVSALQGAKVLARPCEVRPAEALRIVSLVDVPGVREAVQQIMAAERARAQERADKLRAELAEIEERLAELRDAD